MLQPWFLQPLISHDKLDGKILRPFLHVEQDEDCTSECEQHAFLDSILIYIYSRGYSRSF